MITWQDLHHAELTVRSCTLCYSCVARYLSSNKPAPIRMLTVMT
jgi:hypothetical protein